MKSSLGKQYVMKLLSMLVQSGSGIVITALTTQALGPATFGNFVFVRKFFEEVFALLGFGTESAFYTKLSQQPQSRGVLQFFYSYLFATLFCTAVGVGAIMALDYDGQLWPGQAWHIVLAGMLFAFLQRLQKSVVRTTDAVHLTVPAEKLRVITRVCFLALFVAAAMFHWLTLERVFALHYVAFVGLIVSLIVLLRRRAVFVDEDDGPLWPRMKRLGTAFYLFCYPLVQYNLASFLAVAGSYWLLQRFSGSVEQGYFGLAFQISTSCLVISQPMTQLLGREFAAAAKVSQQELHSLVERYIPPFFFLATAVAVFVIGHVESIVRVIAGVEFLPATLVVSLMAVYSIYQTLTQQLGMLFYATDATKAYRTVGVLRQAVFVLACIVLIGPFESVLHIAGAYGFACAHVLAAVVVCCAMVIRLRALVDFPWRVLLRSHVLSLCICGTLAWVIQMLLYLTPMDMPVMLTLMFFGVLYVVGLCVVVRLLPRHYGFGILTDLVQKMLRKV